MLVIAITEDSMEAPQKLKTELPHNPAMPLLGVEISKELEADLKEIFADACS